MDGGTDHDHDDDDDDDFTERAERLTRAINDLRGEIAETFELIQRRNREIERSERSEATRFAWATGRCGVPGPATGLQGEALRPGGVAVVPRPAYPMVPRTYLNRRQFDQ